MNILERWLGHINPWLAIALTPALLVIGIVLDIRAKRRAGRQLALADVLAYLAFGPIAILFAAGFWAAAQTETLSRAMANGVILMLWLILWSVPPAGIYLLTRRHSGRRGLHTALWHVFILFLGWLLGRSWGLLLFSLPLLGIFYFYLHQAALVTLPASQPEDREENRLRARILRFYAWGMQSAMYVVADHAGRKVERRIAGPIARGFGAPGLLWMRSHQVAGITSGVEFRRVDGPGVVYLNRLERPFQIVDLRNQLRVSTLDVTSQDGISYKAILFMAFRLDREEWSDPLYQAICKENPLLERARRPARRNSTYPYSPLRVQAVLSRTGIKTHGGEQTTLHWDEWVVSQVEEVARQELHRHPINYFWQTAGGVTQALEDIAHAITNQAGQRLRPAGVHLLTARVVNFRFSDQTEKEIDSISQQQIESWKSVWERKREELLARSEAEAARMQQEAWAYAQSLLLTSIAEGFERVKQLHPDLPSSAIALLFLSAIQDYLTRYQPGEERNLQNLSAALGRRKQTGHSDAGVEH